MSSPRRRSSIVLPLALIAIFVVGWTAVMYMGAYLREGISTPHPAMPTLPDSGPITIAVAGDLSIVPASPLSDAPFSAVVSIVRRASLGVASLDPAHVAAQTLASRETGAQLRALGFDILATPAEENADSREKSLDGSLAAAGIIRVAAEDHAAHAPAVVGNGERSVALIAATMNDRDEAFARIRAARERSQIALVTIRDADRVSEVPSRDLRALARDAVDAGAQLVVVYGSPKLRGAEIAAGGAIVYGLGPFAMRSDEARDEGRGEGVMAIATFDGERLDRLQVHALDLGLEQAFNEIGLPAPARDAHADAILRRFASLSGSATGWVPEPGILEFAIPQNR